MNDERFSCAAFGGARWSGRTASLADELGTLWSRCGVNDEFSPLRQVLMHRPGGELAASVDPDAVQMLAPLVQERAAAQHDELCRVYRELGTEVHLVEPAVEPPPNLLYVADLLWPAPEGVVVGRPASTVRAGEERWVARRLAALGIPILRTIRGQAVFEGADAMWLDPRSVLVARGLRTNDEGVRQLAALLSELGVEAHVVDLPREAMHLMGALRIVDRDLAFSWPSILPAPSVALLEQRGLRVLEVPDLDELVHGSALNFVVVGPREIVMPTGNPRTVAFYQRQQVRCHCAEVSELLKGAGGIACMTGVLERRRAS
jgi:N-dimethylarginine dimethylaminohydrolase